MGELETGKWQTKITSLRQGLAYLYRTKEFSDVTWVVDNERFEAHRLVLSARSPKFDQLRNSFTRGEPIPVTDSSVTKCGFSALLHFIYNDSLESPNKVVVIETFFAAEYFKVEALQDKCLKEMDRWTIDVNEVFVLLDKAFRIPLMKNKCIEFIQSHPMVVLHSSYFCTSSLVTMKIILECEALKEVPTMELINYVMEWSRTYLNDPDFSDFLPVRCFLLSEICTDKSKHLLGTLGFENLSVQQMAQDIPTCYPSLLTPDEIIAFTTYKNSGKLPNWCTGVEAGLCSSTP